MNHKTDTPERFLAVPSHTRLFRREGGTYYLRAKVPDALRKIIGKTEIRKSLRTKHPKTALRLVKVESLRVDREFSEAEAKLLGKSKPTQELSREEIAYIVSDYVVNAEHESEEWTHRALEESTQSEIHDIAADLATDAEALGSFSKNSHPHETTDGAGYLSAYLKNSGQRWGIEPGTENYEQLLKEFRKAGVEILNRSIDLLNRRPIVRREFADLTARTLLPPPPRQQMALGKFLDEFMAYQQEAHAETTPAVYKLPVRVLRETIGESTPVYTITRQHIEEACKIMRRIPVNMVQRYPGLTIEQAIRAAERAKNVVPTIKPRTLLNYYMLISAIFNFAKEEGYIDENPAKSRKLRETFKLEKKPAKRALFTEEELRKIFNAPLYTGCIDDERGYNKVGENIPKRGRYWVPLLALFHGLRSNEACQLYTEDVKSEDGIPFFSVRGDLDESDKTEKRLKNKSSWREVPIHPQLLKMGFMDYVEERQMDKEEPRFFHTLLISESTGRYSHIFSKWFGQFLSVTCKPKPRATFHSFLHAIYLSSGQYGWPLCFDQIGSRTEM